MWTALFEIFGKALQFVKGHWRESGWAVAGLFLWLWHGLGGQNTRLEAELGALRAAPAKVEAAQISSAKTVTRIEIRYLPRPDGQPNPCPDVMLNSDCAAMLDQALKQTPAPIAPPLVLVPFWGVELSGSTGLDSPLGSASVGAGILAGPVRVTAEYGTQGIRGGLGYSWRFK